MSEQARNIIRRHAPTAAVNARHAAVASVINVHGARYLVDGDGRGKWDAKLIRPAAPMATRRRARGRARAALGALLGRLADATSRAWARGSVTLW